MFQEPARRPAAANAEEGKAPNRTGLPDALKAGAERLSGLSLDNVRVHYHSTEPERLGALAYTRGSHIYVGPGQEHTVGHEIGHVVQQAMGRVRPTGSVGGVPLNDAPSLEREADAFSSRIRMTGQGV